MTVALPRHPTSPAAAAREVREWLLSGPAQLREGVHAGAFAGAIDSHDQPAYAYGEISGYALGWLAHLAAAEPQPPVAADALARAASATCDWLQRQQAALGHSPVRLAVAADDGDDWRNHLRFSFDLAMMLRGTAEVVARGWWTPPPSHRAALHTELDALCDADGLVVALREDGSRPAPAGWSTRPGPFQAKTAAAIMTAIEPLQLSARHRDACMQVLQRETARTDLPQGGDSAHAWLYHTEGLLLAHERGWVDAIARARAVAGTLLHVVLQHGSLREGVDTGIERSDVLAQAIRVLVWLDERGHGLPEQPRAIDALSTHLLRRVDGGVRFSLDGDLRRNVWCSLFAEQALRWQAQPGSSRRDTLV